MRGGGTETTGAAGVGTALPQPGAGVTLRVGWAPPASHAKTMTAIVHPLQTVPSCSSCRAPGPLQTYMDHHPSLLGKLCFKDTKLREGDQIPAGVKSFLPCQREGIWLPLRLKGVRREGYP